jgi:hypothetical protein
MLLQVDNDVKIKIRRCHGAFGCRWHLYHYNMPNGVSYRPLWIYGQHNSKQFLTAVDTTLHVPIYANLLEDRKCNFNISRGWVVSGILLSEISVTGEPFLTRYILCTRYKTCYLHVHASCVLCIASESWHWPIQGGYVSLLMPEAIHPYISPNRTPVHTGIL